MMIILRIIYLKIKKSFNFISFYSNFDTTDFYIVNCFYDDNENESYNDSYNDIYENKEIMLVIITRIIIFFIIMKDKNEEVFYYDYHYN